MAATKNLEVANIGRLKELVEELTVRDEQIFREHDIFEQIVKLVLDGIWIIDENYETIFVNDKICTMLGYIPAEMQGENLMDYLPKELDQEIAKKNITKKKYGAAEKHIFKLQRKDGTYTSTLLTTSPLMGPNKKYRGSIIYAKEITNDEVMNYYKQVFFDVSLDIMLVTDVYGIIQDANYQYCEILEMSKKEIVGKNYLKFVYEEDKDRSSQAFDELIIGNDLLTFKNTLVSKSGTKIPISWRSKPVLENGLIFANGRITT